MYCLGVCMDKRDARLERSTGRQVKNLARLNFGCIHKLRALNILKYHEMNSALG